MRGPELVLLQVLEELKLPGQGLQNQEGNYQNGHVWFLVGWLFVIFLLVLFCSPKCLMDLLVSGVSFSSNKSSSLLLDAKLSWACLQDGNKSRILLFVFGNLSLQSNYGNDLDSLRMKVWHMEFKTLQFYSNTVWLNLLKSVWYC